MPSRDIKTLKYLPPVRVLKTVSVSPLHNTICTRKLEHMHSLNHTMTRVFHFVERKSDKSLDCFQSTFTLMNKVCHLEQLSTPTPLHTESLDTVGHCYSQHTMPTLFVQGDISGTENTGATIFQTITVSLTLNTTAIQSVHKILRQMMMYPQTRFGCKRISSSEDNIRNDHILII